MMNKEENPSEKQEGNSTRKQEELSLCLRTGKNPLSLRWQHSH